MFILLVTGVPTQTNSYYSILQLDSVINKARNAGVYANCERAIKLIDWEAQYSIEDGIRDAFRWDDIRETILNYN